MYNGIIHQIEAGEGCEVSIEALKTDNAQILKDIQLESHIISGEIRTYPVTVGNVYKGVPAEDCEYLLNELLEWLNSERKQ